MTGDELLAHLERNGALQSGHFLLSSGLHSDRFIQKFRIFEDPKFADQVGAALARLLQPYHPQVVVSAAVGGIILGYVVARELGVRDVFVEKEAGIPELRRGFVLRPGERVAVVEDVMTTGKSTQEVIDIVVRAKALVAAVGAVVKRGKAAFEYPVVSLLDLPLADYPPETCPLCARKAELQDPGSRRLG